MSDISSLAASLMALDDKLAACMKCGLCQAVCPVFGETMMEADVTRGKLALLENLAHTMIRDPKAVDEKLNRCLLCGSCQANCPSGVEIMDIFMQARAIVGNYRGLSPIKKLVFRTLLPHSGLFNLSTRMAAPFQGLFLRKLNNTQDTCNMPLLTWIMGSRHLARLPAQPLHVKVGVVNTPKGKSGLKVLFYPGCMGDKYYTNLGEASLKVLAHHGVGVTLPAGLTCCGMPALASGDHVGFAKQVIVNLDVIQKAYQAEAFDYIITPCSSCTATLVEWWPHFAHELPAQYATLVAQFAPKAMDINAFLVDVLKVTELAEKQPAKNANAQVVTYHESCHLKKSLGVSEQPRQLMAMNPNYVLKEMNEADRCCGCGGSFTLFHYDLSRDIGQRKRDNIVQSGASVVATGCPACMLQLTDALSQNNDPVQVKHTIEIYAESL